MLVLVMLTKGSAGVTDTLMRVPGDAVIHRRVGYNYTKHRDTSTITAPSPPHASRRTHGWKHSKEPLQTQSPRRVLISEGLAEARGVLLAGTAGCRAGAEPGGRPAQITPATPLLRQDMTLGTAAGEPEVRRQEELSSGGGSFLKSGCHLPPQA